MTRAKVPVSGIIMQSLLLMSVTLCIAQNLTEDLRWVDHFDEGDKDIFFDRVVAVTYDNQNTVRASGVLITRITVLTTYNPFRAYVKENRANMNKIKIYSIKTRNVIIGVNVSYTYEEAQISCGRQVLPVEDNMTVWHMEAGEQSPLHDLMVLRLKRPLTVRNITEVESYAFDLSEDSETDAGPIVSRLAYMRSGLGDELKFASYGHRDSQHISKGTILRSHEFSYDDHLKVNCDEWLPRRWGHFICIHNVENFPGLASGAVLVHKDLVYGLGSFLLTKGKNSILVFTDVRPYLNLIYNGCKLTEKLVN